MSNSEGFNAGNSQFSLSERVAHVCCSLTTSTSSTISRQEAEFAASAVRSVIKSFSQSSSPFYFDLLTHWVEQILTKGHKNHNPWATGSKGYIICSDLMCLCSFTMDSSCQLYILGLYGDLFSVKRTQVGVFKQPHQICFCCFLKGFHSHHLYFICSKILKYFLHQMSKQCLLNQQVSGLLESLYFSQSNCPWPIMPFPLPWHCVN